MLCVRTIGICNEPLFTKHDNGVGHPESPKRLAAVDRGIEAFRTQYHGAVRTLTSRPATVSELLLIHENHYLERVSATANRNWTALDHETATNRFSYDTALNAAGTSIDAAKMLIQGEVDTAFCAVRPPGHHAEGDRAMGFCIFNNAAIAARWAVTVGGLSRVALVDWDVHHGNGSMHSLYADPDILFISLHQYPHYPGTGRIDDVGAGKGEGYTLNVPSPPGWGDPEYRAVFDATILPVLEAYEPELIIVSAGFDAHYLDTISSIELTTPMYGYMANRLASVMPERNNILVILEGGYHMTALEESTFATLEGLLCDTTRPVSDPAAGAASMISALRDAHARYWPTLDG